MCCKLNRLCNSGICALAALSLLSAAGCKKNPSQQTPPLKPVSSSSPVVVSKPTQQQRQDCQVAARKALGAHARVLRCGEINIPGVQEVAAVLPAQYPQSPDNYLAIWKMVILRHEPSGWRTELTASREIRNGAGYIGLDYIDDSFRFMGYQLNLSDERSDKIREFDIDLIDIESADGGSEASSTNIAWNPAVGRYQEWNPDGFRMEIKNPPHWKPGVKLGSAPPH